jgi:uncharacterized membrane protein YfcA
MATRKKLNVPLAKSAIMGVLGLGTAFVFALAGIGAQVAAAPMIQFLLGFVEERTRGTALGFAMLVSVGGVIGFIVGGSHVDIGLAFIIALGATIGSVVTARAATEPRLAMVRRVGQSIGIVVALYVFGEALRHRIGGPQPWFPAIPHLNPLFSGLILGVITGAVSNVLQVANGILVVPGLIYLLGIDPPNAIAVSLAVIAIASFLPALSYASRGAVDRSVGTWMTIAGVAGGLTAGMLLARLGFSSSLPLISFALVSMFLCAWRIWKMT